MRKSIHILAVATVLTLSVISSGFAAEPAAADAPKSSVVNINTAEVSQLALLPRVGTKAAERIVEFRKENGPFKKSTDLMQVKGFGDKTFALVNPHITIEGRTTLTKKVSLAKSPKTRTRAASPEASTPAQ